MKLKNGKNVNYSCQKCRFCDREYIKLEICHFHFFVFSLFISCFFAGSFFLFYRLVFLVFYRFAFFNFRALILSFFEWWMMRFFPFSIFLVPTLNFCVFSTFLQENLFVLFINIIKTKKREGKICFSLKKSQEKLVILRKCRQFYPQF